MEVASRVRVAFVINDFLIGGAQKLLIDLLTRIDRTRFDLVLITLFDFGSEPSQYLYDALPAGVVVHRLAFTSIWDRASWRALRAVLEECKPTVVFSNLFFANFVTRMLAPQVGYTTIIAEHNTYIYKSRFHQLLDRWLAHRTYKIVAVSETVKIFTARQEGIAPEKFVVIENGIDTETIARAVAATDTAALRAELDLTDEHVIINVARVVPQKHHRLLLEAFMIFAKQRPNYCLLIVGGGSYLEKMKMYAKELGVGKRVHFLGYRRDVPALCALSEFFVSTSEIEGFGIAHAEALAAGLPVLTTKTAGPDGMIKEGVNGFFTDATPEAVARGMEQLATIDRAPLRTAARASAAAYDISHVISAYEALFLRAAHDHG